MELFYVPIFLHKPSDLRMNVSEVKLTELKDEYCFWWGFEGIESKHSPMVKTIYSSTRELDIEMFPMYAEWKDVIDRIFTKPTIFYTGMAGEELNRHLKNFIVPNIEIQIILYEPISYEFESIQKNDGYSDTSLYEKNSLLKPTQIETIHKWAEENNLNKITVFTKDYNVSMFQKKYPRVKLICWDYFLRVFSAIPRNDIPNFEKVSKKFFCANKRMALHRYIVATLLSTKNSIEMSWYYGFEKSRLLDAEYHENSATFFEPNKLKASHKKNIILGEENLRHNTYSIDLESQSQIDANTCNDYKNIPNGYVAVNPWTDANSPFCQTLQRCFVTIVNETKYGVPTATLTEKTLYPARLYRPFILVAPPFSLEYAKSLGFKTFDRWWSEEYDAITNHTERLNAIFDIIEDLDNKPIEELQKMLIEMEDVLRWNNYVYKTLPINPVVLD